MSDVTQTAGPNETSKQLENERKNRIKEAFGSKEVADQEETSENQEKSEEKLDNDQNNSYINSEESESSEESTESKQDKPESSEENDEKTKYEQILNNQFGGDGKKAVKSWKESQKEYTKLRQQKKQQDQALGELDKILEKNPLLEDFIKKARDKGELSRDDLQNFLQSERESTDKPTNSSDKSKLEIVDDELDIDDIDEKTLAEENLLDLSKKDLMSESEWDLTRRQAALKHAQRNLPNKIAEKAYKQFEQQIEDKKVQEEKTREAQKNQQINSERYEKGIDRVVDEFGLDFAGNEEHRELLDEIEERASFMRDHKNPQTIRPNAIYLATLELIDEGKLEANRNDVDQTAQQAKDQASNDLEGRMGFNKSASSTTGSDEPKNLADKLRQRRQKEYEKEMQWRKDTDRLNKST